MMIIRIYTFNKFQLYHITVNYINLVVHYIPNIYWSYI